MDILSRVTQPMTKCPNFECGYDPRSKMRLRKINLALDGKISETLL